MSEKEMNEINAEDKGSNEEGGSRLQETVERVKDGIGKGVEMVSAKSKEILEITRLKRQLGKLQEQRNDAMQDLGDAVYAMHSEEGFDDEKIRQECEPIAALDKQIKDMEEKIADIHLDEPTVCDCGTEISEPANFCPNCGKKIETDCMVTSG